MTKSQTTKIQLRLRFACASNVVVVAAAYLVAADVVVVVADVVVVVANVVETVNLVPSALYISKSELLGNILWAIRLMHIDISTRLRQGFFCKKYQGIKVSFFKKTRNNSKNFFSETFNRNRELTFLNKGKNYWTNF